MCYRIVTMAVLPLLLTRFSNLSPVFTSQEINMWALAESVLRKAFQADKRASGQQVAQGLAVRQ